MERGARGGTIWFHAVAVAFGVCLIALAVPRVVGQSALLGAQLPAGTGFEEATSGEGLVSAIEAASRAVAWTPNDRQARAQLASLWSEGSLYAAAAGDVELSLATLDQARQAFVAALQPAPAEPELWYALARTSFVQEGGNAASIDDVIRMLRMSYLTGPLEQTVIERRLPFSLILWEQLDEELRGYVRREVNSQRGRDLVPAYIQAPPSAQAFITEEIKQQRGEVELDLFLAAVGRFRDAQIKEGS